MRISVRDLSYGYPGGGFRLDIPHLEINSGARVALVGPSGSGKTTFLNLLSALIVPTAGTIAIGDTVVSDLPDRARRRFRAKHVGHVFQDFGMLDYLTGRENILYPHRITGGRVDAALQARLDTLATGLGIGHVLDHKPAAMSQGEQQRVAICLSVLQRADVILADEPTGNLDPASTQLVLDQLFDFAAETGATLIVVTHDHGLINRFDRTVDFSTFLEGAT